MGSFVLKHKPAFFVPLTQPEHSSVGLKDIFGAVTGAAAAGNPLVGLGIQVGTGILGRVLGGKKPKLKDYISEEDMNFSLADNVGQKQEEQFRQMSAAMQLAGRRGVEAMVSSGATGGTGLGTNLASTFNANSNAMSSLLAEQTAMKAQAMQSDVSRRINLQSAMFEDAMGRRSAKVNGIVGVGNSLFDMFRTNASANRDEEMAVHMMNQNAGNTA